MTTRHFYAIDLAHDGKFFVAYRFTSMKDRDLWIDNNKYCSPVKSNWWGLRQIAHLYPGTPYWLPAEHKGIYYGEMAF